MLYSVLYFMVTAWLQEECLATGFQEFIDYCLNLVQHQRQVYPPANKASQVRLQFMLRCVTTPTSRASPPPTSRASPPQRHVRRHPTSRTSPPPRHVRHNPHVTCVTIAYYNPLLKVAGSQPAVFTTDVLNHHTLTAATSNAHNLHS